MNAYKQFFVGGKWDDVFRLPAEALKLWLYHYRCEGGELRESWPTEKQVCEACDFCRDTFYKWRSWLVEHGWLEPMSSAMSVDVAGKCFAPSFKVRHGVIPGYKQDGRKNNKFHRVGLNPTPSEKILPQVDSGFVSGSGSGSNDFKKGFSSSLSKDSGQKQMLFKDLENHNQNQQQPQNQPPSIVNPDSSSKAVGFAPIHSDCSAAPPPPPPVPPPSSHRKCAKDGTPYPDGFDAMSSSLSRLTWLAIHDPDFKNRPIEEQRAYSLRNLCACEGFPIVDLEGELKCIRCASRCSKHPEVPAIWRDGCNWMCRPCVDEHNGAVRVWARARPNASIE